MAELETGDIGKPLTDTLATITATKQAVRAAAAGHYQAPAAAPAGPAPAGPAAPAGGTR